MVVMMMLMLTIMSEYSHNHDLNNVKALYFLFYFRQSDQVIIPIKSVSSPINPVTFISKVKVYQTDITHWIPPILEVWVKLAASPFFLGFAKIPKGYKTG